jgi:hypothetical protein
MDLDALRDAITPAMLCACMSFVAMIGFCTWPGKDEKITKHLTTCTHASTYTGYYGRCPGCGLKATEAALHQALVNLTRQHVLRRRR